MSIPGVRPALHSNEALLSAGAWMDFNQHIHELCLCGRWFQARTLWLSVLKLCTWAWIPQHLWSNPLISFRYVGCPAASHLVCENEGIPSIGIWTRRAVLSRRGATPAETWNLAQTDHAHMHSSGLEVRDCMDGVSLDYMFSQWRLWRLGHATWDEPRRLVLALAGVAAPAGSAHPCTARRARWGVTRIPPSSGEVEELPWDRAAHLRVNHVHHAIQE